MIMLQNQHLSCFTQVHLSVCFLSVCSPVHLCVCVTIWLPVCLSLCLFAHLSVCSSVCPCVLQLQVAPPTQTWLQWQQTPQVQTQVTWQINCTYSSAVEISAAVCSAVLFSDHFLNLRPTDIISVEASDWRGLLELTYQRGRHLEWVPNAPPLHFFLLRKVYPQLQ